MTDTMTAPNTAPVQPFQDAQSASLQTAQKPVQHTLPAAMMLQRFLYQNNIVLKTTLSEPGLSFVGDGFVINDKPLIKIAAEYADKP